MRGLLVVLLLPPLQFAGLVLPASELCPVRERLCVGLVAPFDLAVDFGAGRWDVARSNAQIGQMPGELGTERGAVVGLDALDGEGQAAADLIEESHRRTGVVVVVDPQHAVAGRLVNGGELVVALASSPDAGNELHIYLNRLTWNGERAFGLTLGPGAVGLERDAADVMTAEDLQDRGRRDVDLVVALEIKAHAHGPVAALLADAQDQRDDLGWDAVANHRGSAGAVPQIFHPLLLEAADPDVVLGARDAKEAAGLADVVRDLLSVLEQAKPSLDLAGLLLLVESAFHPGPPFEGGQHIPPVQDVY